jgi:uncharacterized membrane protein YcaP (DUF421 family)
MFGNSFIHIIISSSIVYIFITLALRVFGKKELAQLSVVDIVFVLLISNAVQNAMVGTDTTLLGGLIAAGTLFLINSLFKLILYKSKKLTRMLEGDPVILVSEGKVKDRNMQKTRITTNELLEAIHEHGVESIHDVNLAILEVDGNISILSHDFKKRSVNKVRKLRNKKNIVSDI